ncbi:MAG: alpha/beta hydrolase [Butyrivibrio sp.]|jgi:alpha-beta hydrolase superfamily lysophospholipase|uniref:alpha/beta fold hydrolase n=1 Tax=Butyrivibrio sp. TaxID=28121 RepID=UPI001ED0D690|nr:alpha/beta fold hydrolase [Butyrivibrio sp.]MBE5842047.1 alpha/beta hydrolase [Butyrivibrio sp.]MCR4757325.1 lysophospholipase [Butyrivibrio sp.]
MVRKEELTYKSRDRQTMLHAIKWIPDGQPVAILQIIHGMQEYIDRYDEFARFMAEKGILVMGNDHLGHGGSVTEGKGTYGYFCKNDPATVLVRDAHRLKKMTQEEYPGVPVFILGHSFGSFVAREYITRYGTGINGAIIQGTAFMPLGTVKSLGRFVSFMQVIMGEKYRSEMINNMAFKGYLKKIPNARTKFDWLSHNEESVDRYIADPRDNFVFTLNGFKTMAELLKRVGDTDKMEDIPKNLPILITGGSEDPVGDYGEALTKLHDIYKNQLGITNVELKIYDGMRHELQQEIGREKVYEDQYAWIKKILDGRNAN